MLEPFLRDANEKMVLKILDPRPEQRDRVKSFLKLLKTNVITLVLH